MQQSIADIRKEYSALSLKASEVDANPVDQFLSWFDMAINAEIMEPNAMTVSTIDGNKPSSRIVLLKGVENEEFVFYTNYNSSKGQQMANSPLVSLNFFWPELERQVRIEGKVRKVDEATSDAYFESRPRASQIGAWVSPQSEVIQSRKVLEERLEEIELKFKDKEVDRPPHWGGYAVKPNMIEFWQGRPSRLHDRIRYTFSKTNNWMIERLAP
ncbi:pyridoxine/pyridoxamine 5'-phosphate oxidase [Marivirga tractuosa]|uniref:Pyridoxine/pyridoxamine 5'-phosphate oxidase n=1 Tax=Marivirga tractuosa (strain ATCC 23168 / DSM 4126 / NBRC 15989 / NCIMB 1408 / VKM B-1430 / H-43) TaxID=643867 RepID=E4TL93_MARTH|nr:pyridoxamine 5'-phosphate oxidase [Marivirga tractuosa]ADR20231.1 Pyridoxamine 5'-phosphate oxidase [Marivirga tractuosa DSM 4126]BDD15328.1 pyridoxine/pyridoxamine 5'-phosphate oxidase [Marivirga tractuosa]